MKKSIYLLLALVSILSFSQTSKAQQRTADMVTFPQMQYDFGKIEQGTPVYHTFEFTNQLNKPVIIENVQTTCGCTTPEWDKAPLAPGKTASIRVGYNAASLGVFTKGIQVFAKDANAPYMLKISGEVIAKEAKTASSGK